MEPHLHQEQSRTPDQNTNTTTMSGGAPVPVPTRETILSIEDLKASADAKLPNLVREFYNSGSTDQRTIQANSDAYLKYHLRSRVLVDVRGLETSTVALGVKVKFPLGCAPAGMAGMATEIGELGTARAARRWGVHMAVSSFASYSVEEIVKAADEEGVGEAGYAMQLYPMKDRALQERILKRAEAAGCKAVFLTGDSPVLGVRFNEWRNDFRAPEGIGFPMLERSNEAIRKTTHDSGFMSMNDDGACWETEIKWLKARTNMKIFIKGVVCGEDARNAVEWGCDGIVVSNHGGRQLDGVPATIDILAECVAAAEGKIEVHMDGGIRRGSDIFVAVALGAKNVWVGRPVLWALAHDGQKGVERMLEILYEDFRRCMALCGCRTIQDINKSCLARMGLDGELRPLSKTSKL